MAGSAPERSTSDRFCDLFLREAAADAAFAGDAPLNFRRRLHAAVEDDGQLAADVLAGDAAELAGAVGVQREGHGRPAVLVERRPRAAQIAARTPRRPGAPGSRPWCPARRWRRSTRA